MKIQNGLLYVVGSTGAETGDQVSTDIPYDGELDCFIEIIDIHTPGNYTLTISATWAASITTWRWRWMWTPPGSYI